MWLVHKLFDETKFHQVTPKPMPGTWMLHILEISCEFFTFTLNRKGYSPHSHLSQNLAKNNSKKKKIPGKVKKIGRKKTMYSFENSMKHEEHWKVLSLNKVTYSTLKLKLQVQWLLNRLLGYIPTLLFQQKFL